MAVVLHVHLLMILSSKEENCGLWVARFYSTGVKTQKYYKHKKKDYGMSFYTKSQQVQRACESRHLSAVFVY